MVEWAPISMDGGISAAVKKTIRSHAMREYRQRQRDDYRQQNDISATQCRTKARMQRRRRTDKYGPQVTTRRDAIPKWRELSKTTAQQCTILTRDAHPTRPLDKISLEGTEVSPQWSSDCVALFGKYIRWLRADDDLTKADIASYPGREYRSSPLVLAASVLAATRHLQAAHLIQPCTTHLAWKDAILNRLLKLGTGLDEDSVKAVACLLHFELCQCSEEALVHLRGLKAAMRIAAPMPAWQLASCTMSLEMGDLLHALIFQRPFEALSCGTGENSKRTFSVYHLSILASELQVDHGPAETHELQAMKDVYHSMSVAATMMELSLAKRPIVFADQTKAMVPEERPLISSHVPEDVSLFVQAQSATIGILYNYAVQKLPIQHAGNQGFVDQIVVAVMHMDYASWRNTQYSRLFILMTGLCAATEQTTRSFFEAHLVRAILQLGNDEWISVRTFIIKYIENRDAVAATL